jgi:hypothetical protein
VKSERILTILTAANLVILLFVLLSRGQVVKASSQPTMLRGSGLEIVDAQGKVRAMIAIVPAGPAKKPDGTLVNNGKSYPEAVLFRLIRPDGRPSVKIATTEEGSGLTLSGGIDPTYIVLNSNEGSPEITLTNKDGKVQTIKP